MLNTVRVIVFRVGATAILSQSDSAAINGCGDNTCMKCIWPCSMRCKMTGGQPIYTYCISMDRKINTLKNDKMFECINLGWNAYNLEFLVQSCNILRNNNTGDWLFEYYFWGAHRGQRPPGRPQGQTGGLDRGLPFIFYPDAWRPPFWNYLHWRVPTEYFNSDYDKLLQPFFLWGKLFRSRVFFPFAQFRLHIWTKSNITHRRD